VSLVRDGIPAAPGIVIAPARVLRWEVPRVPHAATIPGAAGIPSRTRLTGVSPLRTGSG